MKPTYEELEQQLAAVVAENAVLKETLEYIVNPDNQPEYHAQGMGCGIEDRGYQRDGYSACYYGWESAMERVYSEVIPESFPGTSATDAYLAEVRAQGVEMFADYCSTANNGHEINPDAEEIRDFAAQLRQGAAHE